MVAFSFHQKFPLSEGRSICPLHARTARNYESVTGCHQPINPVPATDLESGGSVAVPWQRSTTDHTKWSEARKKLL